MGSLIHSLGGGFQVFDDYDWNRSDLTATSWIQWWKYGFGLALYGLGLNGHHDSGFASGYWAIYTSTANHGPWVYADVGLADLVPENGSQIGLKYSSFDDTAGPSGSINTIDLILTAPPAGQPPRLVSIATIASDRLELTFATIPGCTYQLEENEFLAPDGWNAWGGIWVATATETVFTIQVQKNKPKCFYRLHLLP